MIHFARRRMLAIVPAVVTAAIGPGGVAAEEDPLPSWNAGDAKAAILDFVGAVTTAGGPDYVPPAERIAVFDNDGTLWVEQPYYTQLQFALDRIKALAPQHPEWVATAPFASVLRDDLTAALAGGEKALVELIMASHAGTTTDEFTGIVRDWLASTEHPTLRRAYTKLVFRPMLEVLALLRARGFKTFIVSGGTVEFLRPWTEEVYGVPPEQVIGSSIKMRYEVVDGRPAIIRLPEVDFIDDKAGKPVGIQRLIGRRPIAAFGNSDGDFEMLEWTTTAPGRRLGVLVHHDDAAREYAYDRESHVGRLDRGLDEAGERGWVVVSMRRDWTEVFSK